MRPVRICFVNSMRTFGGAEVWMLEGGKQGRHSERLGYILAELQFMQRTYPGCAW